MIAAKIALQFGITIEETFDRLSAAEYQFWQAWHAAELRGEDREDLRLGMLSSTILSAIAGALGSSRSYDIVEYMPYKDRYKPRIKGAGKIEQYFRSLAEKQAAAKEQAAKRAEAAKARQEKRDGRRNAKHRSKGDGGPA